jgi:hypothetical protein
MDSTLLAAMAAALGSALGAAASISTTWITQRTQIGRGERERKVRDRESLYGEFITEASRLSVEALRNSLEEPETLVKLYGILGRIRLVAAESVLEAGEACCRRIVELYSGPNMTAEQIRVGFEVTSSTRSRTLARLAGESFLKYPHARRKAVVAELLAQPTPFAAQLRPKNTNRPRDAFKPKSRARGGPNRMAGDNAWIVAGNFAVLVKDINYLPP